MTSQLKSAGRGLDLPYDVVQRGSGWAQPGRDGALARLSAMELPARRDEYWKYTDPTPFIAALPGGGDGGDVPETVPSVQEPVFEAVETLKIVFVDGVFDAQASDDLSLAGIEISRLAEVEGTDIHWAKELYGLLEARGQTPVSRPLAAMNTACATDGVLLHVTGQPAKPVELKYIQKKSFGDVVLHHCLKLESGARVSLLESGSAAARLNTVCEVDVADGAQFHHLRVQGCGQGASEQDHLTASHIFARLGTESICKSFTLSMGGKVMRNETVVELTGDDGCAHVAGAAIGSGDFHHDDTVFVTHDAVNCESRQVFKKVLRDGATGVFQGKILVQPDAQKTDGYQISQSLLLDDDSQFLAKPELEIYADDVACSHGSTSGAIDETALFYLRARGVPLEQAQDLLVLAFLGEALDEIDDETLAEHLRDKLTGWFARRYT